MPPLNYFPVGFLVPVRPWQLCNFGATLIKLGQVYYNRVLSDKKKNNRDIVYCHQSSDYCRGSAISLLNLG